MRARDPAEPVPGRLGGEEVTSVPTTLSCPFWLLR
jgi:hypothetical protein